MNDNGDMGTLGELKLKRNKIFYLHGKLLWCKGNKTLWGMLLKESNEFQD